MSRSNEYLGYVPFSQESPYATPVRLLQSLELSRAQAQAGLSVPLEPALDRLRASIA